MTGNSEWMQAIKWSLALQDRMEPKKVPTLKVWVHKPPVNDSCQNKQNKKTWIKLSDPIYRNVQRIQKHVKWQYGNTEYKKVQDQQPCFLASRKKNGKFTQMKLVNVHAYVHTHICDIYETTRNLNKPNIWLH